MKVLIATESYWPNLDGGSVVERNLAHGLADLGHEVRVVAPSPTGKAFVQTDGNTDIHRTQSFKLPGKFGKVGARGSWFPSKLIKDLIDGWQPDIIHIHNPFTIGRAAMKHGRAANVPVVATNHNMPENTLDNLGFLGKLIPNGNARIWKWQMKFLNQANFVTSPTQTAVDLLLAHGLSVPNKPVSNGVDLKRYNTTISKADVVRKYHLPNKPIVLYMGRLDAEKRMDVWLKSAPLIRQQIDAHFLIGGRGGEVAKLKRLAAELGVAQHVTFAGSVPEELLPAFYHAGTVFAISSPAELQSLVLLEAMASGLPVAAADAAALPELCKSGRNGYLFMPGNPDSMAKSVTRILQNPAMGKKMGVESRKIVEEHHDVRKMPKNYANIYKQVIR
ncbi:glycosyltransferase family 4 protein [Patescibacteria group bacterium]|nr:glycosyltransferase family 4 protein [Patescibacteria group bacterium]